MKPFEIKECPFSNLPEAKAGRWGAGLTATKMNDCLWLKPVLVGQIDFVEWTEDGHLRHSKFVALREDIKAKDVVKEDYARNRCLPRMGPITSTPLVLYRHCPCFHFRNEPEPAAVSVNETIGSP
jgi:hypothetical protein